MTIPKVNRAGRILSGAGIRRLWRGGAIRGNKANAFPLLGGEIRSILKLPRAGARATLNLDMTLRRILPVPTPVSAIAVSLFLWSALPAAAQPTDAARISNWELNLHGAALRPDLFDESSGALQFGGRLFRNFGSGLSVGANVDWARSSDVTARY